MTLEVWLLGIAIALLIVVLMVLLLRRPSVEPVIGLLQAAQDRQAERVANLVGEMQLCVGRAIAEQTSRLAQVQAAGSQGQQDSQRQLRDDLNERLQHMAVLVEQVRGALSDSQAKMKDTISHEMSLARDLIDRKARESRADIEMKIQEIREINSKSILDLQASVQEKLGEAVEKQMNESFTRVIDQFNAIQAMMGNVQSVAAQVGDLRRIFSNVKTRGGWGESQVKAMLDDFLPSGSYETNIRLREDSNDTVEFAILMPTEGDQPLRLPLDAKFPIEDYHRLLNAHEIGDSDAETQAKRALEVRIRNEAQKISNKYVNPPMTTDFAVMYLPTEGLYAEIARIPGLLDDIQRNYRVCIASPTLLPAMLRMIQLGYITLAISRNTESVRNLLAATKFEIQKMDDLLVSMKKQVGTVSSTIGKAQIRTRAIGRKLKDIESLPEREAQSVLKIEENFFSQDTESDTSHQN